MLSVELDSARSRNSRRGQNSASRRSGFSLVELIVVIIIIGMLAGLVAVRTRSYLVKSRQEAARVEIRKIVDAIQAFEGYQTRYPTNEEGLEILATPSDDFVDGLLSKVPTDPWGNPYVYNVPGENGPFEVFSLGADGREGGEGEDKDIRSDTL